MELNEQFYNEMLASGISETVARSLCMVADTRDRKKKKKTGNPAAGYFAGLAGKETEIVVTYECRVCGSTRKYTRTVKGDGEDSTALVQTCRDCAKFLLNKSKNVLIGALVLQNHIEKDFRELALYHKLNLAGKKTALSWLKATMSPVRNGSGPDTEQELVPTPAPNPQAEAEVRAVILAKLVASGVTEDLAELMIKQIAPAKKTPRKRKLIPFKDIVVTKLCRTCKSSVSYKVPMRSLDTELLTQECSFRICENCIGLFESMQPEQLVALLLIQNSRDVELRLLDIAEQLKLAMVTEPVLVYNLHVQ